MNSNISLFLTLFTISLSIPCSAQNNYGTGQLNGNVKQIIRVSYEVDTLRGAWAQGKIKEKQSRSILHYDQNGNCTSVEQTDADFNFIGRTLFERRNKHFGYEMTTQVFNRDSVLVRLQVFEYDFEENPIQRDSYHYKEGYEWSQIWVDKSEWYVIKNKDTTGHGKNQFKESKIISRRFDHLYDGTTSLYEFEYDSNGRLTRRKLISNDRTEESVWVYLQYDKYNNWTLMGYVNRTWDNEGTLSEERTLTTREYLYY